MSLIYLPGRPNDTQQSTCQSSWQKRIIFAYCSGNNVIVLSSGFQRLQTIYLESDGVAVDVNPRNGFIAIAHSDKVSIFKPVHEVMKNPSWEFCCEIHHDDSKVNSLNWGNHNDLTIGSDYLSFWKIDDEFGVYKPVLQWNKKQPKPVYICITSEDSQMIASFGKYDTSVKLWKRISISGEEVIFNLTLLPHPSSVCTMRWRRSGCNGPIDACNRLQAIYTLCDDKKLRVWLCYELDSLHNVQQWGTLQLETNQKYCLVIDRWLLKAELDLVLLGDTKGYFTVFSLTNLSTNPPRPITKEKLSNKMFSYSSFVVNPNFLHFAEIQLCDDDDNKLSMVIHDFRGVIRQSHINIKQLLDRSDYQIGTLENKFTGHNKSVQRLIRSSDGEAMLTISRFSESCVWRPQYLFGKSNLKLTSVITTETPIKHTVIHEKGKLVICLLENSKLQAWECIGTNDNGDKKSSLLRSSYNLPESTEHGDPILMLNTPEPIHSHEHHFIALIYEDGAIKAFKISSCGIEEAASDPLKIPDQEIYRIATIDPVHQTFFSDRPLISLMTRKGIAITYKAVVNLERKSITWTKNSEINTGLESVESLRGSSTGKLCIVHSKFKKMSLWDLNKGVLEYEQAFDDEIKDIDWTSTEYGQSIVSIGFTGYALLYTQLRYDYVNNNPSYLPIEKIDITAHTAHRIGDSIWLKNGMFVVASGNQFYIKDKFLDLNDPFTRRSIGSRKILSNDILHLSTVLNGPLPVYHPQFLIQALYANKLQLVKELLLRLFLGLRKLSFESEDFAKLSSDLDIHYLKFLTPNDSEYKKEIFPDPYPEFNKTVAAALCEQLTKITLPYLTRHQQITLITVVEAVEEIRRNESIVDYNGIRFLLGVKLFGSHRNVQKTLLTRDINWALHSDNKELLLSIFDSRITSWAAAREYKISYWVKEEDLIRKFEQIAKFEFSKDEKRNPSNCAIFYLALKKKKILCSLWKISTGHPEQQKMMKFLNNDFSEARWKKAALKNAFVLLSKHRYMDAACFFLLADSLKDSINVLLKQIEDLDLAIGICRVNEGDNGPVLGEFLSKQILPGAIIQNDRWISSFIYWKLKKQDKSIRALVTDPIELENDPRLIKKDRCINKSFLAEDPALLILYSHLRKRNLKYFLGSLKVESRLEYGLVWRVSDILRRMGCDYLALSLVRNWEFLGDYEKVLASKTRTTSSGIFSAMMEPTTTNKLKYNLLDKFESSQGSENNSYPQTDPVSKNEKARNILDDFLNASPQDSPTSSELAVHSQNTSGPKDDSSITNQRTCTTQSDYGKDQKELLNPMASSRNVKIETKKISSAKPRNLLDDFM
ncbi:probable Regulator of V-ATPase in vacuolar membrane protein 1 [Zygosaccharomyces bailii ISA1307]|uniref:ZYBA0S06-03400g1_1 n=1 Tax=Zygosaccharomyces bailii (strain CLIB 213 / ATCC 58445 / CBS 680 / BCRC 21525 / NBRC 1098 / NCYC 1416 / NRRL Y-2227) TaxID=1333698 RepID=A0A8J2X1K4_ZYGB2|nr:ZYBA0S06-03400g1_1 [Zygosaccharomyces bailii CLIB 213]CDH11561.1 probable Regulator of V-ATPase in vacuolar membrane protein 1 [Zygosaccharomyces bailii ISA1307]